MKTDTHELIESLSKDVKPVRPLPRAAMRATVLSLWAMALGLLTLRYAHEERPDLAQELHNATYLTEGFLMALAGACAAFAAFRLAVPDTRVRGPVKGTLGLATLIWGALIVGELAQTVAVPEAAPSCFIGLTMAMSLPLMLGLVMVMRSAPVFRGWAGYALVLSIGSFGALGMRFICPNDSPGHLLVWHFLPVMAFALLGVPLGKVLLNLKIAKK